MNQVEKINVLKFKNNEKKEMEDNIVNDNTINLFVNNLSVSSFSVIKDSLKEFAIGYLLGQDFIKSPNQIENINIDENNIYVTIKNDLKSDETVLCSDASGGLRKKINTVTVTDSNLKVDASELIFNMEKLTDNAEIWKATGGTHVAALVVDDKFILREDVSRHVAVDKVIGAGALEDVDFNNSYVIYSGRMPQDMVIKLNRVGIPLIVSNAAPAYSGYKIIQKSNMTMVGFLRGNNFNVYGKYDRIKF